MSSFKVHKKAAIISYINFALTIVLGLFTTPFIIKMLGDSQYGLYTLIGAFVGYLSVLDLGLNSAIVRYVAQYRAQNDKRGEENFLAISFLIYIFIGLLIAIIGFILYLNIDALYSKTLTVQELSQAKIMTLILIANLAITIPGGAFAGICNGYEKFIFPRVLTIIKHITRISLLVVILYAGSDALDIVILDTVLNIFFICGTAYYVFRKLKIKIHLYEYKFAYVKDIFMYSFWTFLFAMVYQFIWNTGQIILGTNTGVVTVGVYSVGIMLGIYYTNFGNIVNGLLTPKAVQSVYGGLTNTELTKQMIKIGRLIMIVLLFLVGGFFLIGKDFIFLWVGKTYANAWLIALFIMVSYVLIISQGYSHSILEAKKRLKFKSLLYLVCNILGLFAGWLLSYRYREIGMIIGVVSGLAVFQIIMNIYLHNKIGLDIILFFRKTVFAFILPFFIVVLLNWHIDKYFVIVSWTMFFIKVMIYFICYIISMVFVLKKEDRQIFKIR
jgi:O-antigen/teichoic acid export membrane protein